MTLYLNNITKSTTRFGQYYTWCHYRDYFTSNKGIKCGKTVERMTSQFQVSAPESFSFKYPEEWPKWIRRFERYLLASGLDNKSSEVQVNALIYNMGDQANNILLSFRLSDENKEI